ncbi:hypothetical protein [Dactylosporangium sp. CA-092794]|uniref:hypothetical protein n=1 Tax=Dactylosporangium sp. CA-092794 TaxID=3239929 RepID=UPI003D8C6E9B
MLEAPVIRVGALRQRVEKAFVPGRAASPTTRGSVVIRPAGGADAVWLASGPLRWQGSPDSRAEATAALRAALADYAGFPPGIDFGAGSPVITGADVHVLEVASTAEQEVLCNLIREHVPLLIALTGRPSLRSAAPVGSHRLANSHVQVAARYLDSTSPQHLARVTAELRRRDGIMAIDRMDVFPSVEADGTLTVTVGCIDAAVSLAATRAHALLLAAFGVRARRLVRAGARTANPDQALLEENRARAIARGIRARLTLERRDQAADQQPARVLARELLVDSLAVELDNLQATAAELFPLIALLDLAESGVGRIDSEDALLSGWARTQGPHFSRIAADMLLDDRAGGPCLSTALQVAPGRTQVLLDEWAAAIARRRGVDAEGRAIAPRRGRPAKHTDQRQPGQNKPGQGGRPAQRKREPRATPGGSA